MARRPLVSICIPTRNREVMIRRALDSALAQDYENIEVVVVDDGSTDGTAGILAEYAGTKLRSFPNNRSFGQGQATTKAAAHARGELIKFLDDDDELDPTCVSELIEPFDAEQSIGMAFCRRRVQTAGDVGDALAWLEEYSAPHRGFGTLRFVNRGPVLFDKWMRSGLRRNLVGEPATVMVRRAVLSRVGGFHRYIAQHADMDLWVRLVAHTDVGFVDAELATYHYHADSLRTITAREHLAWLDRLWLLESLTCYPAIVRRYPEILEWRSAELSIALRTAIAHHDAKWPRPHRLIDLGRYAAFRLRRARGAEPLPFETLEGAGALARSARLVT